MNVLLTGGTGFIGRALCARLLAAQHQVQVLSRDPSSVAARCGAGVGAIGDVAEIPAGQTPGLIVNLAGEPIAAGRWTRQRKRELLESRLRVTRALTRKIAAADAPPGVLISASAVGYYGATGDRTLDEDSPPVKEFQHDLCQAWEEAALAAVEAGWRVCILRLGIVLGPGGGALQQMLPAFRLGLGGPIGNGRQWMSWIHLEDVLAAITFLQVEESLSGIFNATAPHPVMNRQFARALGAALRRPAVLPVPGLALRAALGELSHLLLTGQHVLPRRLQAAGFGFAYPRVEDALGQIFPQA